MFFFYMSPMCIVGIAQKNHILKHEKYQGILLYKNVLFGTDLC